MGETSRVKAMQTNDTLAIHSCSSPLFLFEMHPKAIRPHKTPALSAQDQSTCFPIRNPHRRPRQADMDDKPTGRKSKWEAPPRKGIARKIQPVKKVPGYELVVDSPTDGTPLKKVPGKKRSTKKEKIEKSQGIVVPIVLSTHR